MSVNTMNPNQDFFMCKACGYNSNMVMSDPMKSIFWVVCTRCGNTSPSCQNREEAIQSWQSKNKTDASSLKKDAVSILYQAAQTMIDRATAHNLEQEHYMDRTMKAFNVLTRSELTETDGWLFVILLQLARCTAAQHNPDVLLHAAVHAALALESMEKITK